MKRWIHAKEEVYEYPEKIFIELYPSTHKGAVYEKQYEHEGGGCYYRTREDNNPVTSNFVSLYSDGHLTYLWNGSEKDWNREWRTVKASTYDPSVADEYVVKIWHEVEGMRGGLPSASEEIFVTVANSPQQAIEQVKREWGGPIDRIEIVDINPDDLGDDEYMEIPYND